MIEGCFLAIPLPEGMVKQFQAMMDQLKDLHLSVRYQKAETPHLTLLYFGTIREDKLEKAAAKVEELVKSVSPFHLVLADLGYFGTERFPRVVWMAPQRSEPLQGLQDHIHREVGIYSKKKEGRPFHAHLTIARIDSPKQFTERKNDFESICRRFRFSFLADRIRLYVAYPQEHQRQVPIKDFPFSAA